MLGKYEKLVVQKAIRHDAGQHRLLIGPLSHLADGGRSVYIHGPVGCGKTFCLDLFVDHVGGLGKRVWRTHFHKFMLDTHRRVHNLRPRVLELERNIVAEAAHELAQEVDVLAFDEFQVTDIADAMILKTLIGTLLDLGVGFAATSNRPPEELYKGGLNRAQFLPAIDHLIKTCEVVAMGQKDYKDYRLEKAADDDIETFLPQAEGGKQIDQLWRHASRGVEKEELLTLRGRSFKVRRSSERAAIFEFDELCRGPSGAEDYLALADRFDLVVLAGIPKLDTDSHNEARRLITLIDALYDAKCAVVLSSAAESPTDLFGSLLEAAVDVRSDEDSERNFFKRPKRASLDELVAHAREMAAQKLVDQERAKEERELDKARAADMLAARKLAKARAASGDAPTADQSADDDGTKVPEIEKFTDLHKNEENEAAWGFVEKTDPKPERSTKVVDSRYSMVQEPGGKDETEFSATGQKGVSLFAFSAVEETKFAYARAASRIVEMRSGEYLRASKGWPLLERQKIKS